MSVLIIPDVETSQITATLNIKRLSGPKGQLVPYGPGQTVVYQVHPQNSSRCRSLRLWIQADIASI